MLCLCKRFSCCFVRAVRMEMENVNEFLGNEQEKKRRKSNSHVRRTYKAKSKKKRASRCQLKYAVQSLKCAYFMPEFLHVFAVGIIYAYTLGI